MKRDIRTMAYATVICAKCGTPFRFWRKKNRRKSAGHIKHVYCVTCQKVTEHREQT